MPEFVKIGHLLVGRDYPVRVQSMLNTDTSNIDACVKQTIDLVEVGCEMVRLSIRNIKDVDNLYNIKNELFKRNIVVPIIADVHFNPKIAELAAGIADKIRINPGNYIDNNISKDVFTEDDTIKSLDKATNALYTLTEICKKNDTVIRVGSNHGSLSKRIVYNYGNTAQGMVVSVNEFIKIFKHLGFEKLVISLKSSNPTTMVEANRLFVKGLSLTNEYYPIHLGVTEAGAGNEGRIRSAIGIGALLSEGIGDTIRVSLSENPVNEIVPAKEIANKKNNIEHKVIDNFERIKISNSPNKFTIIGKDLDEKDLKNNELIIDVSNKTLKESCDELYKILDNQAQRALILKHIKPETSLIDTSLDIGYLLSSFPFSGIISNINDDMLIDILQILKLRLSKPEYISCPTCARTEYNLEYVLSDIKKRTKHLKNISIAVMGCIVNGPGEMRDADIGIVGYGKGKVIIFIKGKRMGEAFPAEEAGARIEKILKS